jgi:hypothetical protein
MLILLGYDIMAHTMLYNNGMKDTETGNIKTRTETIPVRFTPEEKRALMAFCTTLDRPYSRVIRAAVREYLEKHAND